MNLGPLLPAKWLQHLRRLGFDAVLDTNFTADLTIVEEASELVLRLKKKFVDDQDVALPMLTSCSPGWVKYIEQHVSGIVAQPIDLQITPANVWCFGKDLLRRKNES